jgi:hypothetical protein
MEHPQYGPVIYVENVKQGLFPLQLLQQANKEFHAYQAEANKPIRFLVDEQLLTINQLERWANDEHNQIPKCFQCAQILIGEVYCGTFHGQHWFCSSLCRDQNFLEEMERINDEHECDFQ